MTQQLIVFAIVALAAGYAVWHWMPAAWRRAAAAHLAAGSRRAGLLSAERADRLAAQLARKGGCADCDSCGACATPAGKGQSAAKGQPGGTVREQAR